MYRSEGKKQLVVHFNFLFDMGGIGDFIAALPALKYIYDKQPHVVMHIWMVDYLMELTKRSLPKDNKRILIRPISEAKKKFNNSLPGRSFKHLNVTSLSVHPVDVAFMSFMFRMETSEHKNYISLDTSDQDIKQFNLPEKYVVIPTNYTAPVRQFLPEYINQISDYIISKGYTPVFVGKSETHDGRNHTIKGIVDSEIDFTKGINLLDKTKLLETREIIKNSKCIVGLDNGLIHLAATTEVPIVVGYTSVEPNVRMPYRHDELGWNCYPVVPPIECQGCQSLWNFTINHNFMECYYEDKLCIYQLKPELYIKQLEKIL